MKSTSEQSFGSRLEHAKGAVIMVEGFSNFQPSTEAIKPENLKALIHEIETLNKDVQQKNSALSLLRSQRVPLYYGEEGIIKRSILIRDYLGSLTDGATSNQHLALKKICQKMRNYHPPKKETEAKADAAEPSPKTISKAETGFGALLLEGKNVVEIIKQHPNYQPVNPLIQCASLEQLIQKIETANAEVNKADTHLSLARDNRSTVYETLAARIQQLKSGVASQYGKQSKEYQMIVKIKV